jgi:hypothetical protein
MKKIYVSLIVQCFEGDDAFREHYTFKNPYILVPEHVTDEDTLVSYATSEFESQIVAICGKDYDISGGEYCEEEESFTIWINTND